MHAKYSRGVCMAALFGASLLVLAGLAAGPARAAEAASSGLTAEAKVVTNEVVEAACLSIALVIGLVCAGAAARAP